MEYVLPFEFVLQYLYPVRPRIVKMLGGFALYLDKKMLFFLRDRPNQPEFNGIFVATQPDHYQALQQEIHTSHMEFDLDGSYNSWIFISEDLDEFKEKVQKACELVKKGDDRIGK